MCFDYRERVCQVAVLAAQIAPSPIEDCRTRSFSLCQPVLPRAPSGGFRASQLLLWHSVACSICLWFSLRDCLLVLNPMAVAV